MANATRSPILERMHHPYASTTAPRANVRVVVADPTPATRAAVADTLGSADGIVVIGQVADLAEARAVVRDAHVDVLVVDDRLLGDAAGLRALAAPLLRLVAIGMDDHPAYVARAHRAGASWVPKHLAGEQLLPLVVGRGHAPAV